MNSTSGASTPMGNTKYVPPKGWDEISADEKIERLREIIKENQRSYSRIYTHFEWLKKILFNHNHNGEKLSVQPESYPPSDNYLGNAALTDSSGGKPYF